MHTIGIRTIMLLARADASPGTGRNDKREQRAHAPEAATVEPPPSVVEAAPEGAPSPDDDVIDDDVKALITTIGNDGAGGVDRHALSAFVRGAAARGHEMQPKIGKLEDGQAVLGVFMRWGRRSFKPDEMQEKLAKALGEKVKPRTVPTFVLNLGSPGQPSIPVEFTLAHDIARQFAYYEDERGAGASDLVTPGVEVSVTRTGTRRINGGAQSVGDYLCTVQTRKPAAVRQ